VRVTGGLCGPLDGGGVGVAAVLLLWVGSVVVGAVAGCSRLATSNGNGTEGREEVEGGDAWGAGD
jgi:hypothetical protein